MTTWYYIILAGKNTPKQHTALNLHPPKDQIMKASSPSPHHLKTTAWVLLTYAGTAVSMKFVPCMAFTVVGTQSVHTALLTASTPYCTFINI